MIDSPARAVERPVVDRPGGGERAGRRRVQGERAADGDHDDRAAQDRAADLIAPHVEVQVVQVERGAGRDDQLVGIDRLGTGAATCCATDPPARPTCWPSG